MRTLIAALLLISFLASSQPAQGVEVVESSLPIDHVVFVMQEDRTFNNYFGTYPGADGWPKGYSLPVDPSDPAAARHEPFKLEVTRTPSPPHSTAAMVEAIDDGSMQGFIASARKYGLTKSELVLGYYDHRDIPFYWGLADRYVLADRWFSSVLGPSFPNHLYAYAATRRSPDGTEIYDSVPEDGMDLLTIFDRLEAAGVSWKVYVQGYNPEATFRNREARMGITDSGAQLIWVPLVGIPRFVDEPVLNSKITDIDEYYEDLDRGTLPQVAFVTPSGLSEHPPGDLRLGHFFAYDLLESLMMSEAWWQSVFILTWDEWGGWADHVPPPQVDEDGYGVRVPALIVSPYAKRGHIDSTIYDHTTPLAFIERLYGVEPLAERDANADPLTGAFDFDQAPRPPELPPPVYEPPGQRDVEDTSAIHLAYSAVFGVIVVGSIVALGWGRR